jgi:hypothetical protein
MMATTIRLLAGSLALLVACTSTGGIVDHTFAFNAGVDSPDVEVMDYRYGSSRHPGARNEHLQRDQGKSAQGTSVTGPMPRGDDLYVKWKIKHTGVVYEDTVDLRHRLPSDITGQRVYFLIRGSQLHVYLVSKERRAPGTPAIGSRLWSHLKAIEIYPDRP